MLTFKYLYLLFYNLTRCFEFWSCSNT